MATASPLTVTPGLRCWGSTQGTWSSHPKSTICCHLAARGAPGVNTPHTPSAEGGPGLTRSRSGRRGGAAVRRVDPTQPDPCLRRIKAHRCRSERPRRDFHRGELGSAAGRPGRLRALLFGAEALRPGGSFEDVLDRSKDFATGLGERLRERVYNDVVRQFAGVVAAHHHSTGAVTEQDLAGTCTRQRSSSCSGFCSSPTPRTRICCHTGRTVYINATR